MTKFMLTIIIITCFSLSYVWQQTEIFRLAYEGQKNLAVFQGLSEKNNILKYNIKRNTSLVRLGNKISGDANYQMPSTYRLVKFTQPAQGLQAKYSYRKESLFSYLFGVKRVAEAQTTER